MGLEATEKEKALALLGIEPKFLGCPIYSLVAMLIDETNEMASEGGNC